MSVSECAGAWESWSARGNEWKGNCVTMREGAEWAKWHFDYGLLELVGWMEKRHPYVCMAARPPMP